MYWLWSNGFEKLPQIRCLWHTKKFVKGKKQVYKTFGEAQKFQNKLNEKGLIWDF